MHIITRKRLIEFSKKHPNTLTSLDTWYRIVKQNELPNFSTLRQIFPSADKVDNLTVLAFIVCIWVGYQMWVTPIQYSSIEFSDAVNGVKIEREVIKLKPFNEVSDLGVIPLLIPVFICLLGLWATFKLKSITLAFSVLLIIVFWLITVFSIGMTYSAVVLLLIAAFAVHLMAKWHVKKIPNE